MCSLLYWRVSVSRWVSMALVLQQAATGRSVFWRCEIACAIDNVDRVTRPASRRPHEGIPQHRRPCRRHYSDYTRTQKSQHTRDALSDQRAATDSRHNTDWLAEAGPRWRRMSYSCGRRRRRRDDTLPRVSRAHSVAADVGKVVGGIVSEQPRK